MNALFIKRITFEFLRSFGVFFLLGVLPVWDSIVAGDWDAGKAALLALIGGAVTAAVRGLQALFTTIETDPALKQ